MNKKKLIILSITLVVLILTVGIAYAYFSASYIENTQEEMIVSGDIILRIDDVNIVTNENFIPGDYIEKKFTITNTSDSATLYDLYFSDLYNSFSTQSELVYTLTSDNGYSNSNQKVVPDSSTKIVNEQFIDANEVHNYTLKVLYKDITTSGGNDVNNMGKELKFKIKINDYNVYPIATLDKGQEINKALKQLANPDKTITSTYTKDTNIKSIEIVNALDESKDYVNIADSNSAIPVYAWYDVVNDKGKIFIYTEAETIYMNSNSKEMFHNLTGLELLDLSIFDSSKVTLMGEMFSGLNLSSINLSPLDTSNVTSMYQLFLTMKNLESIDLSPLNTSKVTDMSYMFRGTEKIETIDISPLDTSSVTNMASMFSNMKKLTSIDLSTLDTSNVTNMGGMFEGMTALTSIDLTPLKTSKVTDMKGMFSGMTGLTSIDITPLNTSNVTNMSGMFNGMTNITNLDLRTFDTSKVTDMYRMFSNMTNLTSVDLSSFNTEKVTNMGGMFYQDSKLQSLNLSSFNTSNVTSFCYGSFNSSVFLIGMFEGVSTLSNLDITNFNTSKATSMCAMFKDMKNIEILDLSSFDTSKVTEITVSDNSDKGIFVGMEKLKTIYVSDKWDVSTINTSREVFRNSPLLVGGAGTTFNVNHLGIDYAHVDEGPSNPGYLTLKPTT